MNRTPTTATLSDAVAVNATVPLTVALAAGGDPNATVGGVASTFVTVTAVAADGGVLPAASRAPAVNVWTPFGTAVVFHDTENGDALSVARKTPSSRNWMIVRATLSEAVAVTATVPLTVALLAGAVNVTAVGAVVSTLLTVTDLFAEVAVL